MNHNTEETIDEKVEQSLERLQRTHKQPDTPAVDYLLKYGGRIATLTEIAAKGLPEGGGE